MRSGKGRECKTMSCIPEEELDKRDRGFSRISLVVCVYTD